MPFNIIDFNNFTLIFEIYFYFRFNKKNLLQNSKWFNNSEILFLLKKE